MHNSRIYAERREATLLIIEWAKQQIRDGKGDDYIASLVEKAQPTRKMRRTYDRTDCFTQARTKMPVVKYMECCLADILEKVFVTDEYILETYDLTSYQFERKLISYLNKTKPEERIWLTRKPDGWQVLACQEKRPLGCSLPFLSFEKDSIDERLGRAKAKFSSSQVI